MKKFEIYADGEYYDAQKISDTKPIYSVTSAYGVASLLFDYNEKLWKINPDFMSTIHIDVDKVGKAITEKLNS